MMPIQRERAIRRALIPYTNAIRASRRAAENAHWQRHDRLAEADKAVWRCAGCGGWLWGSRACAVCPRIVEVAA